MNLLVNNEANECVELLINTLAACHFKSLLNVLIRKKTDSRALLVFFEKSK